MRTSIVLVLFGVLLFGCTGSSSLPASSTPTVLQGYSSTPTVVETTVASPSPNSPIATVDNTNEVSPVQNSPIAPAGNTNGLCPSFDKMTLGCTDSEGWFEGKRGQILENCMNASAYAKFVPRANQDNQSVGDIGYYIDGSEFDARSYYVEGGVECHAGSQVGENTNHYYCDGGNRYGVSFGRTIVDSNGVVTDKFTVYDTVEFDIATKAYVGSKCFRQNVGFPAQIVPYS